jgi:hypothetical protein
MRVYRQKKDPKMLTPLNLEVARLRHQELVTTAERRSALLRNPTTRRPLSLVRSTPARTNEAPQVERVA